MAWAVLFDLVFQCTFFAAALVLDERRQARSRVDCCCCLPPRAVAEADPKHQRPARAAVGPLVRLFRDGLAPRLGERAFAALSLTLAAALLAFGFLGMTRLEVDFSPKHILRDDSFALRFIETWSVTFREYGPSFSVVVEHERDSAPVALSERFDYPGYTAGALVDLSSRLSASPHVAGPHDDWLDTYDVWATCAPCCDRHCALCAVRTGAPESCAACAYATLGAASGCVPAIDSPALSLSTAEFHEHLADILADYLYGAEIGHELAYTGACRADASDLRLNASASAKAAFARECAPRATRLSFQFSDAYNGATNRGAMAKALVDIRGRVSNAAAPGGDARLWPYHPDFVELELYISLHAEARSVSRSRRVFSPHRARRRAQTPQVYRSVFIVAGVVLLVSTVLLVHPTLAVFVGAALASICVNTLGFMHWWGVPLNPPSYMCVVISIGLSVDYCAHVLYAFALQPPGRSRLDRTRGAVSDMGPSVFKGGFTTFLGVALLLFSPLEMFHFFVKPLTLAIVFGMLHGCVLVPVACVYFGPDAIATREAVVSPDPEAHGTMMKAELDLAPTSTAREQVGDDTQGGELEGESKRGEVQQTTELTDEGKAEDSGRNCLMWCAQDSED